MKKYYILVLVLCSSAANATDLVRFGGGAGNQAVGGIIGLAADPLSALNGNPALLSSLPDSWTLSLSTLSVESEFTSNSGEKASADSGPGVLPQIAFKHSLSSDWSWGLGVSVQSAMQADFKFEDPPGTLGVSYGEQTHLSEFVVAKLTGGVSYQLSSKIALGLALDVHYNRNKLQAPYIFQSHPVLSSLKVLVDLEADDVQISPTVGLVYSPTNDISLNISFAPEVEFSANGFLDGDLSQLGLGIQEQFSYDANVRTGKPQTFLLGLRWQATPQLNLGFQIDRIYWEDTFRTLPISLVNGSNADLNAFLGSDTILDTAPLNWRNQDNLHLGVEYTLPNQMKLRAGLEDNDVPVPSATITPMTAAILDRAFSAGIEFQAGDFAIDLAYRFSDASTFRVIDSGLLGGEYDNTVQSLKLHTLTLSLGF